MSYDEAVLPDSLYPPSLRDVLVEVFKLNPEGKIPEALADHALDTCRKYARDASGKLDESEYEELVAVAIMAALMASGMTTEDAIIDYKSGKYPAVVGKSGKPLKYVFGVGRKDTPLSPKPERPGLESPIGWAQVNADNRTGKHSRGGGDKDNSHGNTAKTWPTYQNADYEGSGLPWFMRPDLPPHCESTDWINWHWTHPKLMLGWLISARPECECDNVADSRESRKWTERAVGYLLRRILDSYRDKHPAQVEAFELYYMSELSPTEAVEASEFTNHVRTLKDRADWIRNRLLLDQPEVYRYVLAGYGWNCQHMQNYRLWRKRLEQPYVERGQWVEVVERDKDTVTLPVRGSNGKVKPYECALLWREDWHEWRASP